MKWQDIYARLELHLFAVLLVINSLSVELFCAINADQCGSQRVDTIITED